MSQSTSSKPRFTVAHPVVGPIDREGFFAPVKLHPALPACPRLGLGTAWIGSLPTQAQRQASLDMLHQAWSQGFLLCDTASTYARGVSQQMLGQALASWSGPRQVVATKIGGQTEYSDQGMETIRQQFAHCLEDLHGHVDLLAAHEPHRCPEPLRDDMLAYLHELADQHQVTLTGLGGGGFAAQSDWVQRRPGSVGYIITHLRLAAVSLPAVGDLVPLCAKHSIKLLAASPTFAGMLGHYYDQYDQGSRDDRDPVFVERAREVKKIADELKMPLSQLAIRFVLSMPFVDAVLAGATDPSQWDDTVAAYHAGPLPGDVYQALWCIAQQGSQPEFGG